MTTAQIETRKNMIQNIISKEAGFNCELTIISESMFSLCAEGKKSFDKVVSWLKCQAHYNITKTETHFDEELNETFFYFHVA